MALILSSSGSAPRRPVMICRNTITTTLSMSFRDEIFTLGAPTDRLTAVVAQACVPGGGIGCYYCCVFVHSVVTDILWAVALGTVCDFPFTSRPWRGCSLDSWKDGTPLAACQYRCCTALFLPVLVVVVAPAPHTTGTSFAVAPALAEFLIVLAL